jgi:hypothetical protein
VDKLRLLDHLIGTQDQQRATSRARLRLSEQLLRRLRLITLCLFLAAHLIELLLETLSGPADEGFDLRSEGRYIRCCGLLRIAAHTGFSNGGIYKVELGGVDMPLAELVFGAGDLAAFDCLEDRRPVQAGRFRSRCESVRHCCPQRTLNDVQHPAPQWLLNC